jgi:predicted dienelactone hydrolase
MRICEILLLIICTFLPFVIALKAIRLKRKFIIIGMVCTLLLHLFLEGYRWQMVPVYISILILIWCLYKGYSLFKGGLLKKAISGLLLIILLLLSWTLPYTLPVFQLPIPTGTFSVGSQYLHLKSNQDEILTTNINDKRELMIKVWYPAQIKTEETESYLNEGDRIGFAVKYGLPKSVFNYLDQVKTNTYKNPKVKNGKFPVLIFSHGLYSKASGYYALLEEIVSHGYIVLNINHTYESTGALFPDGRIRFFNKAYDQIHNNQNMADRVWSSMEAFNKATSAEEKHASIKNLVRNYYGAEVTKRWSNDISLVIDTLEYWNANSFLTTHLDISKIGVFGHSQGGSAAGQAVLDNKNITAGMNIDGVQWGTMIDTMLTKPFAILSSDWESSHPNFNPHIFKNGSTTDFYNAKLLNSGHASFMDIPLMINWSLINESGTIDPIKSYEITNTMVLQFFDKYLLNKPHHLLEIQETNPEIDIELIKTKIIQ